MLGGQLRVGLLFHWQLFIGSVRDGRLFALSADLGICGCVLSRHSVTGGTSMTKRTTEQRTTEQLVQEVQDANTCLALGAGLGAFGVGTTLLAGATCPLCVILAPALVGAGIVKRYVASRRGCAGGRG